jgi:hypothetical protein
VDTVSFPAEYHIATCAASLTCRVLVGNVFTDDTNTLLHFGSTYRLRVARVLGMLTWHNVCMAQLFVPRNKQGNSHIGATSPEHVLLLVKIVVRYRTSRPAPALSQALLLLCCSLVQSTYPMSTSVANAGYRKNTRSNGHISAYKVRAAWLCRRPLPDLCQQSEQLEDQPGCKCLS